MEHGSTEPRLSAYLHAKACRLGLPLAGNFELTPRCNLSCRMCYVRLTAEEQLARGRELSADEWLAIADQARARGMLFLLLTGGEPLIRPDLRHLLTELERMGIMVSINSNASLIDADWLAFFRHHPPFRFNITLYGGSEAAYERLCGQPVFARVLENVRALRAMDVSVKLNASIGPYNCGEIASIYALAEELGTPMQLATYLFPPIRRDEAQVGGGDRFTAEDAARYSVAWDRLRFPPEQFALRAERMAQGIREREGEACEGTPGEGIACRAGRSAFWIDWRGQMTPCGMMNDPAVSVPAVGFAAAWAQTKRATEAIRMPAECAGCAKKEACHACAAMCVTETGRFDGVPRYVCRMTDETVRLTQAAYEELKGERTNGL